MPYIDANKAIRYGTVLFNTFKRGVSNMLRVYRGSSLIWTRLGVPDDKNFYVSSSRVSSESYLQAWNKSGDLITEVDSGTIAPSSFGNGVLVYNGFVYVINVNKIAKFTKTGTLVWNVLGDPVIDPGWASVTPGPPGFNRLQLAGSGRIGQTQNTFQEINADTGARTNSFQIVDSARDVWFLGTKKVYSKFNTQDPSYTIWYGGPGWIKANADWTYNTVTEAYCSYLHSSGVFAGSRSQSSPLAHSLTKLNTNGTVLWQRRDAGTNRVNPRVYMIKVDNNNNVYCVGTRGANLTTHKLDSNGTRIWARDHGTTVWSISIDESNGDVYTTGQVVSNISTRKYNSAGTLIWSRRVGGITDRSGGDFG